MDEEIKKELEIVKFEFLEFKEKEMKNHYNRIRSLVMSTYNLLNDFSFTIQLRNEDHLKGTIKLEGFQVKSGNIQYKLPKGYSFHSTSLKPFPLENIQRSHHFLEDVMETLEKLEIENKKKIDIVNLLKKNEEILSTIQNSIDQFVLPYSSIYSSFPHLNEKFLMSKMKNLQKKFDPPLRKEIIIEINVFQGQLVVSFHHVKIAARRRVNEIKMKSKGRFVEIETENPSTVGYIKRSFKTETEIGYFIRSISNLSESVDILKRMNDKLRIFSSFDNVS